MKQHSLLLALRFAIIFVFGIITVWSTAPDLFLSQLSFAFASLILAIVVYRVDTKAIANIKWSWYLFSLALLALTYLVGRNIRGSIRWIDMGFFNLQTSEIVKPLLLIFFAKFLTEKNKLKFVDIVLYFLLLFVPFFLVYKQPDLGSALSIMFFPIFLLAIRGFGPKLFIFGLFLLAIFIPLEQHLLKPYQRQRIESFLNPYADPKGAGYNVIQANIAIGSGGFWGKGVRLGTQSHLNFLPERHTDFIFSSFAEEFGLFGSSAIILIYFSIFLTLIKLSLMHHEKLDSYIIAGFTGLFSFQTIVNIGMNLGVMPVTGITLPLFSYGGSSLISFGILFGLLFRSLDRIRPFND